MPCLPQQHRAEGRSRPAQVWQQPFSLGVPKKVKAWHATGGHKWSNALDKSVSAIWQYGKDCEQRNLQ